MTSTAIQIMTHDGQYLPLQRDLRDALATFARREWPRDTAKHAARAWQVPQSTAANILKGHASAATLTHVLRVGGWAVAQAVVGAVIGQAYEDFLQQERHRLERERSSHAAREASLIALEDHVRERRSVGRAGAGQAALPDRGADLEYRNGPARLGDGPPD